MLLLCGAAIALVATPGAGEEVARQESVLLEGARLHPDSFDANRSLGEFYIGQHRLEAAIPCLEKARRIDPGNYENAYDLALAYLQNRSTARSREIIADLIRRKDRAELHNLLGDVEERESHVQEAAQQYEIAARMDPSEKNLFDLGSDLMLHRGFEPALKVFTFGAQRYPQSARLRVGLGTVDYALGRYDEAVENLCQAVDLDPKDTKALGFLGDMYNISPTLANEVAKRLAGYARTYPDNAAANYYYALSLRKHGSQREAERLLLQAVKLNPQYAQAHFELGLLYEDEKRDADAIRQYKIVIQLSSANLAKAHYRVARLYKKSGQATLAQKEFEAFEALKGKPGQ